MEELSDDIIQQIKGKLGNVFDTFTKEFSLNFDTTEIYKKIIEVDEGAREVIKTFGAGAQNIRAIKDGLTDAVTEVNLLGGGFQDIVDIQVGVSNALNRNVVLTSESYEKLFSATKVAGVSADYMVSSFKDAGISAYQSAEQLEDVVNISNDLGLNTQKVTEKVLSNMTELNRFNFEGGVDGLAKMAAQATNLRIDMQSTMGFAEKVFDPEGAIETAAALQRLGVAQSELLDPLRLMDLAQNDPTELQNQLVDMTKQFVKLNDAGDFEIAPGAKRQLREISREIGISYQELSKMALGSSELDRKMQQIKFPETFSEEDRIMIANMSEMGEGGDYKIQVGDETKLTSNLDPDDLKVLREVGEGPETLEEIQKEQLSYMELQTSYLKAMSERVPTAIAGGEMGPEITESILKQMEIATKTAGDVLGNVENSKKITDEVYNTLTNSTQGLIDGSKSLMDFGTDLSDLATDITGQLKDNFKESVSNANTELSNLKDSSNNVDKIFGTLFTKTSDFMKNVYDNYSDTTTEPVPEVKDFIKLPGQTVKPLPEDTIFGGTNFEGLMERLGSGESKTTSVENKTTADINLNIKIDAPSQIDTNQLMLAFNNQGLKEKVVESITSAMYNNGLTAPTSSKTKLMNPNIS